MKNKVAVVFFSALFAVLAVSAALRFTVFKKAGTVRAKVVTPLAADKIENESETTAISGGKFSALAVSGPFGAVKEQASGLYAQTMAERGFLTIAFDPSFTGESGGNPRYMNSPDINTED
mgnify:CR=1 FL=1